MMEKSHRTIQICCLLMVMVSMAITGNVPLETSEEDDNVSTYIDGDSDDLLLSIKVTSPDDQQPSRKQTYPWTTRNAHRSLRPVSHGTERENTPRPSARYPKTPKSYSNKSNSREQLQTSKGAAVNRPETKPTAGPRSELDFDIPEDKAELKNLVQGLKDQLQESQTVQTATRSILNVVQERQTALEEDLSFLKNEISSLHRLQKKDRDSLNALKDLVSDNTWGITSLVTSQEQLKKDVLGLKQDQDAHNASLWQIEEVVVLGVRKDEDFQNGLQVLQKQFFNLRQDRNSDHKVLEELRKTVIRKTGMVDKSDLHGKRRHHNGISGTEADGGLGETSNRIDQDSHQTPEGASVVDLERLDSIASAIEDKHNVVEHSLEELARKERNLKQDMEHFSQRFGTYDTELARVYTMFFNLSYQMSALENKVLQHQQKGYESNLSELQQSLMNFTHHLYTLDQSQTHSRGYLNKTGFHTQPELEMVNNVVTNLQRRLENLEKLTHEDISSQGVANNFMNMQIGRMNNSISRFYKSFQDHHIESTDVFDFIEEKFMEFNRRITFNDDRLLQVEVRVLNQSLAKCEKESNSLMQERKLNDVDQVTTTLRKEVDTHNDLIDRLDHGMTRIFEDFGKHTKIVDNVLTEVKSISAIVPQVANLKHEVKNIIMHLPKDCSEISKDANRKSGPQLIRPQGSDITADAYCEFEENSAWTVIQRRKDGSTSFARDWADYKYGFGSSEDEFWIGNDNLHYLTAQGDYMLQIQMWDLQDRYWLAEYDELLVDEEGDNYRLHIDGYSGNATDALRYSNYMPFSTIDKDNDVSSTHCARFYTSGWWYKHCHYANLNGRYTVGVVWFNHDSDEWIQLKQTVMKIKSVKRTAKDNNTKTAQLENETSDAKFDEYYQNNS